MTERRTNFHVVIISRRFFMVKRLKVSNLTCKQLIFGHILLKRNSEDTMLAAAKDGQAFWLISVPERLVHDAKSAFTIDCKPNQHSDGSKIAFDEVGSAIKRINPYYSVSGAECLEKLATDFVGSVCLAQLALNNCKPALMAVIKASHLNKSSDLVCNLIWFYRWFDGVSRLFAFFTLDV